MKISDMILIVGVILFIESLLFIVFNDDNDDEDDENE